MASLYEAIDGRWWSDLALTFAGQAEGIETYFAADKAGERWRVRSAAAGTSAGTRLEREAAIAARIGGDAAERPAYVGHRDKIVLVYPADVYHTLADTPPGEVSFDRFLGIAERAAISLMRVHASDIVHGALEPAKVLIDEQGGVCFADFGRAHVSGQELASDVPEFASANFRYAAPEQTRRERPVMDQRSDLYALGAILYEFLVGRPPLLAGSIAEWLHAHVAITVPAPSLVRAGIPPVIDQVLLKLLAKEPSRRYQSAEELRADVAGIIASKTRAGRDGVYRSPEATFAVRERLAESLVGRRAEVERLAQSFRNVRQSGRTEMVLLSGAPGTGKSSLVSHLLKSLDRNDAISAMGKGDPLRKAIPYAPIVQALRSALEGLHSHDQHVRNAVHSRLAEVPGCSRLLADLIPDVELVQGGSQPLPEVPAHLAQVRTTRILRETFAAIASAQVPLILFFDDLQWFDGASLDLAKAMLGANSAPILLICSCRSDDGVDRLWRDLSDEAMASGISCTDIRLSSLAPVETAELVAFALGQAVDRIGELSAIIHRETKGSPFYISQLLHKFTDEQVIAFDPRRQEWGWDQARLLQGCTVVEFMARRLSALPERERHLLRTLAFLGRHASVGVLSALMATSHDETLQLAEKLMQANLLARGGDHLTFSHDRVREAAYSLIDDESRPIEHLRIARHFLAHRDFGSDLTLDIASQIERADRSRLEYGERLAFARVLLAAARHSRSTGAVDQALRFLDVAADLRSDGGAADPEFPAFATEWLRCDCLLALARVEEALQGLDVLLDVAVAPVEIADTYRLRALALIIRSQYNQAIEAALLGLSAIGIAIERLPALDDLERLYQACCVRLQELTPDGFLALPDASDEVARTALPLLSTLISSSFVPGDLRFLHVLKIVEVTLNHGVTPESAYGLAWFGVYGAHHFAAYEQGLLWAETACRMVEREGYEAQRTAALLALDQVSVWTKPMRFALDRARDGVRVGQAAGDLGMACYARNHVASNLLVVGEPLPAVRAEITEGLRYTSEIGYRDIELILDAQMRLATALLTGENDRQRGPDDASAASVITQFWVHHYAGVTAFLFNRDGAALRHLEMAMDLSWSAPAHIDTAQCCFFFALASCRSIAGGRPADDKVARLDAARARFAAWARLNPDTFESKSLLLEAEAARLSGGGAAAQKLYEQAARAAEKTGFIHDQALAHELAGQYYLEAGLSAPAQGCLIAAEACYRQWGATGKATHLAVRFPQRSERTSLSEDAVSQRELDLAALTAAAQTLAEEVGLEQVLRTLMRSMIIHAGAQFGLFLLVQDGVPGIEASAWVENQGIRVDLYSAVPSDDDLPISLLTSVMRTKKAVTFADVSTDAPELDAPGPRHRGARSLACIPFIKRGDLVGVLYLENSLSANVFTPSRTAMLEVLAAQAAISLDAARLYRNLIDENRRRAEAEFELREARAELGRTSQMTALGSFAASIVHEINQPIASIITQTEAALRWLNRDTPDIAEVTQGLIRIRNSGRRTADIVKSLRSLGKQAPATFSPISLEEVVEEVVRLIADDLDAGHVKIMVELAEQRRTISADRVQLQQVIFNLVTNAIHAMAETEQAVRRVVIRTVAADDGTVRLSIEDNGCGMSDEIRSKIFDPFFTTKTTGMGVGLAICRSIVELHRGTIGVRSTLGQGSTFDISIPVAEEPVASRTGREDDRVS
ncbi:trifunctional serine/threonine-protein kinase/ATP-binding protein/sensor histidine kinase [Bradyrhizobium sp. HKCCYLR20261]|uniref:trifunctional serine/threonine-protein kinase/ATP-binding protein/sensor histidine kinase n=1 Tax=Bradyrhizobium sp. HKCCYLR20261 TaxID=3420760 RepID=UPI003EB6D954